MRRIPGIQRIFRVSGRRIGVRRGMAITGLQHFGGIERIDSGDSEQKQAVSFHAILGIPVTASRDQIRSAYHTKLFETHPDHGGSAERFLEVREAYQALVFPDDSLLREFAECVWENDTKRAENLWNTLMPKMKQSKTLRFDGLYFDAILYACKDDAHYEQLTRFLHTAAQKGLFVDEESMNVAYDSLLWHLKEGNRLRKCDVHLLFDCLHYMHENELAVVKDGWYSMHYWQG
mmetsp:Transcript_15658/g.28095  ORF Transcript_15658/g.28095 Transcript_15658/m.28095 type:complete len:233 (-) Transcript_15658:103-801(-)